MAMIPEEPTYESNTGEPTGSSYENNSGMNYGLYDAQVYAVTAMPEPDFSSFESASLSQKSSESFHTESKDMPAPIERMPFAISKDVPAPVEISYEDSDSVEIDMSDPAFALFADQPTVSAPAAAAAEVAPEDRIFGAIPMEKALERFELVTTPTQAEDSTENGEVSVAALERFQRLCYSIESPASRIRAVTAHL